MSKLVDRVDLRKRDDNSVLVRKLNGERFMWHEKVIADQGLSFAARVFASAVMHKYRVGIGYAALSFREAAKRAGMSPRYAMTVRNELIERGWLIRLGIETGPLEKARYALRIPQGGEPQFTRVVNPSSPHPTGRVRQERKLYSEERLGKEVRAAGKGVMGPSKRKDIKKDDATAEVFPFTTTVDYLMRFYEYQQLTSAGSSTKH